MTYLLDSFTLLDLCDILILAVLIYHFVLFLKKEIAIRLILMLLIFFCAFFVSQFSGFSASRWFLCLVFSATLVIDRKSVV